MEQRLYVDSKQVAHATDDQRRTANATYKILDGQLSQEKRQTELLEQVRRDSAEQSIARERVATELKRQSELQEQQLNLSVQTAARTSAHHAALLGVATSEASLAETHRQFSKDVMWLERCDAPGKAEFLLNKFEGDIKKELVSVPNIIAGLTPSSEIVAKHRLVLKNTTECDYTFQRKRAVAAGDALTAKHVCESVESAIKEKTSASKSGATLGLLGFALFFSIPPIGTLLGYGKEGELGGMVISAILAAAGYWGSISTYLTTKAAKKELKLLPQKKIKADAEYQTRAKECLDLAHAHEVEQARSNSQLEEANDQLFAACTIAVKTAWDTPTNQILHKRIARLAYESQLVYPPNCRLTSEEIETFVVGAVRELAVRTIGEKTYSDIITKATAEVIAEVLGNIQPSKSAEMLSRLNASL